MTWLLDTCVLSELTKPAPHTGVIHWVNAHSEDELFISALTLGELARGIALLAHGAKRQRLEKWLDLELRDRFQGRILPVDESVGMRWGQVQAFAQQKGKPMPVIDGLLAATALAGGHTIVTRNGADMAVSGVELVNPWG